MNTAMPTMMRGTIKGDRSTDCSALGARQPPRTTASAAAVPAARPIAALESATRTEFSKAVRNSGFDSSLPYHCRDNPGGGNKLYFAWLNALTTTKKKGAP